MSIAHIGGGKSLVLCQAADDIFFRQMLRPAHSVVHSPQSPIGTSQQGAPMRTLRAPPLAGTASLDPTSRPPLPPCTFATATQKVRLAEDAWNTRDPARVALASALDSTWRNRSEFLVGREAIVQFLQRKWAKELDYRLIKELWAFHDARIAVRFAYEWHDD